jgi:hypothetical protein
MARHVVAQSAEIDSADIEHLSRIGVLAQGKQQMLEQNLRGGLAGGIVSCPEQRRLKTRRHRHPAAIISHCLRHSPGDPMLQPAFCHAPG